MDKSEVFKMLYGNNYIITAIGNPDGPPKWKGLKPDSVILDESWTQIGTLADYKTIGKENVALDPLPQYVAPSYNVTIEVLNADGKPVEIPLNQVPWMEKTYSVASSPKSVVNANFTIQAIHYRDSDGGHHVQYGPFHAQGVYNTAAPALNPKTIVHKPQSVQIKHEGSVHNLAPGDQFMLEFDVQLPGMHTQKLQHTIQIGEFNYKEEVEHSPSPASPFLKNVEEEKQARHNHRDYQHKEYGTFSTDWIESLECYVVNGYYGNKRYEIVVSEPLSFNESWSSIIGHAIPKGLHAALHRCSVNLSKKRADKRNVFKHPKLHEIMVQCPGKGQELAVRSFTDKPFICPQDECALYDMIQHLNDSHQWTREAIAEWIDTLDEQPVFYPVIESERVANSAKVVVIEPPV